MINKIKKTDQEKVNKHLDNMVRQQTMVSVLSSLPSQVFEEIRPSDITPERWKNVCQWIIDSILRGIKNERYKDENYVALSSVKFKKILGNKYKVYVNTLIDSGILECDGHYSIKQGESLGYRIHHSYMGGEIRQRKLTDKSLLDAIRNYQKSLVEELKAHSLNLLPFTRWLTTDSIVLDKDKAQEFLDTYMHAVGEKVLKADPGLIKNDKLLKFLELRYRLHKEGIKQWSISRSFTIDQSGGRLHTPLTNMPSILRNFLTTREGEPLVSIDIRNSQPFHFVIMFNKSFWKRKSKGATLYNIDIDIYNHLSPTLSGSSPLIIKEAI